MATSKQVSGQEAVASTTAEVVEAKKAYEAIDAICVDLGLKLREAQRRREAASDRLREAEADVVTAIYYAAGIESQ